MSRLLGWDLLILFVAGLAGLKFFHWKRRATLSHRERQQEDEELQRELQIW